MADLPNDTGELDVLIVGAGLSGIYQLYHHRKLGHSVRVFEAQSDIGGTWRNNVYPGARVDSEFPNYQLSMSELWNDWTFKERYPGWKELQEYFHHIDQKWNVRKDISFNTKVVAASFDQEQSRWVVTTESRLVARPRFLVLCVGVCSKVYTPQFEGLDTFGGACYHTARWPKEGVELKGKRIGVIGTGASGVQVIQEVGPQASHLTVFQRTPNMALPMRQKQLDSKEIENQKLIYPTIFRRRLQTGAGFSFDRYPKSFDSTSIEERILHREDLWALGGFHFVVSNFKDFNTTEHGHRETYNFWRDRVRKRIHDPVLQEKLAPPDPIHPIGAKRLSLEQSYYEVFNQKNVKLVDLNECGISKITSKGILTDDGTEHDLDVLVLATGFDSLTGGLADLGIQGVDGTSLAEKWANGVYTTFGMTCANYPNMFFVYGPQAPTAYVNGPSLIEVQCDWVAECIRYMKYNDFLAIYPTHKAEAEWRSTIMDLGSSFAKTVKSSWYFGSNIPGKVVEPLNYSGGLTSYIKVISGVAERGYEGFQLLRSGDRYSSVH